MTQEALIAAVEEQRSKLLNVLGTIQCMRIAVSDAVSKHPPKELEGAVMLLEEEVQRIVTALDEVSLYQALSDRVDTPAQEAAWEEARKARP